LMEGSYDQSSFFVVIARKVSLLRGYKKLLHLPK